MKKLILITLAFIMTGCSIPQPEVKKYGYHEHDSRRKYCSKEDFLALTSEAVKCINKYNSGVAELLIMEIGFVLDGVEVKNKFGVIDKGLACFEPAIAKTHCTYKKVYHVYDSELERKGLKPCSKATGEAKKACDNYRTMVL